MKYHLTSSFYIPLWIKSFVVLIGLILLTNIMATASSGIQIDNRNRHLVASHGETYQWYLNGRLLPGHKQQSIEVNKSGEYLVEITDEYGDQVTEVIRVAVLQGVIHRVFIIGDSTVATYSDSKYPQKGWGQIFQLFFNKSQIEVINKSIGGRSSRSFYQEGRWTEVVNSLSAGDYVFIQFGHNDRDWTKPERYTDTADYKYYLRIYVNETRAKGAVPVLVSPMIMHAYRGTTLRNVFTENENDYRGSMLQVAGELDVPFVDLNMKSHRKILEVGQEYASYFLYLGLLPGEYPNFPDGSSDGTHFQEMGALEMGKLIIDGIEELEADTNIAKLISALVPMYDLKVEMNIPDAGLQTISGKYPAGAQVTVKTRLKSGYSFYQWEDDSMYLFSEKNLTIFTMQPQNYSLKALVKDCNETIGGYAVLDNCGICTGGTTENLKCTNTFQSEKACEYTGTIESRLINGINRTFINTGSFDSPYVLHTIYASSTDNYQFALICSAPDSNQKLDVYVNDEKAISNMEIEKSEDWKAVKFELNLEQGTNDVKLNSLSADGGLLFDQLSCYSGNLSSGMCKTTTFRESGLQEIIIYPNPFKTGMQISGTENLQYQIYDMMGIMVEKGICKNGCNIGNNLQKGLYMLFAINESFRYTQVIQKL